MGPGSLQATITMPKTRVKNIDVAMCQRVKAAFKRLGMTYEAIAADAGIPSKTQLIEVSNGIMEPSKRILRYLCSKGFSAQWLLIGDGPELWMGSSLSAAAAGSITKQVKKDIAALSKDLSSCVEQITDLKSTLDILTNSMRAKGPLPSKR